MKNKNRKFNFKWLGYSENVFQLHKDEIQLQNRRMVETTSFIGGIIMLMLTLAAFFVPSIARVLPLYFSSAIGFTVIYIIVRVFAKKSNINTLICNYAFLLIAFGFAMGLDIIQKNPTATTICVLLVALPLLIVDKPIREVLFFLLMCICFMLESVYIKQSPKASVDVLNSLSFFLIGSFLGYKHSQMMLRNINGQHLLKIQRDTDNLTNLYNKAALEARAKLFLDEDGAKAGFMVMDMDNFKFVNDTYGHDSGDEILKQIGTLLPSIFRKEDYLCRFGGDEFLAFLPSVDDEVSLKSIAERVLEGLKELGIKADAGYKPEMCIGIAIYPRDGDDFEGLFKSADTAMYAIKKHGKNGYSFFGEREKDKILVVDDVEMNRAILKKTLEASYDVYEAENGIRAWEILEANKDMDMIITDIQMPCMDGIELIKRVRSNSHYDNVAIIANSQYGDPSQETMILGLGADDFVYKAASHSVIQARVKNVMKAKEN